MSNTNDSPKTSKIRNSIINKDKSLKKKLSNKREDEYESIKSIEIFDNDDDDDNNDDIYDDEDEDAAWDAAKKKKKDNNIRKIALPGGTGVTTVDKPEKNNENIQSEIVFYIRSYLDILFGSVIQEAIILSSKGCLNSEYAIPTTVSNILKYNNIMFSKVTMSTTIFELHEPLWYDMNIVNSHLHLYLYKPLYDSYCTKLSDHPVIISSGIIPLENYNPIDVNPQVQKIDAATINCAVICDHVAQHIISDVLNPNKPEGADIHEKYNLHGTTLHSMLDITCLGTQSSKEENTNFITLTNGNNFNTQSNNNILNHILNGFNYSNPFSYSM